MANTIQDGSAATGTDLSTVTAIKAYLGITGTDDDDLLGTINTAVSRAIERSTGRKFHAANYSEWYDGRGSPRLMLNQAPIINVKRICVGRQSLLNIANTSTDAARAMVRVSDTAAILTVTGGDDAGEDTLTFADYTTITTLAAAVNLLTNWTATVPGDTRTGNYPTTDLTMIPGWNVGNSSWGIVAPSDPLMGPRFEMADGIIYLDGCAKWSPAMQNVFVEYRAGYATLPADLVFAATTISATVFRQSKTDMSLKSEKLGDHSWTRAAGDEVEKQRDDLLAPWYRFKLY